VPELVGAMASTNKSLTQINKSLDEGRATKKHSALRDGSRAERAEFYFDLLCQLAPAFNGRGLFRLWQRRTNIWRERTNLRTRSERPSGVGSPVVVAPPPTDAQVIAGTILGIAGMAINASMYRRHW